MMLLTGINSRLLVFFFSAATNAANQVTKIGGYCTFAKSFWWTATSRVLLSECDRPAAVSCRRSVGHTLGKPGNQCSRLTCWSPGLLCSATGGGSKPATSPSHVITPLRPPLGFLYALQYRILILTFRLS